MAISVTANLTEIANCDSVTGWSNTIAELTLDTAVHLQGSGCLSAWVNNTLSAVEYYTISATDMSGGEHVYVWMKTSGKVDTKANGGYRIVLYTDSSNYATFYVGGNDTHPGNGWNLMVVDPNGTPDEEVGTFNPASVTRVGIQFKTITTAVKQGQVFLYNVFWDILRYGTGLTITSGPTDAITLEDIFAVDDGDLNKYGVLQKSYESYILNGTLKLGDSSSGDIDFEMTDEVLIAPGPDEVSNTFNQIDVLGNSGGTTNFEVNGSFIKALNKKLTLNLNKTDLNTVSIKGSSFGNVDLDFAAGQTITGNVFGNSLQIVPRTATFQDNVIKNTQDVDAAVLYPTDETNIKNNTYLDNTVGAAIELDTNQEYDITGETFSGNTNDILNSSGSAITVNKLSGSDPLTSEGSGVTFVASIGLELTGLVIGTEVHAYTGTPGASAVLIGSSEGVSSPTFTMSHNVAGQDGFIMIHKPGYVHEKIVLTYKSTDQSIPVKQDIDIGYKNP